MAYATPDQLQEYLGAESALPQDAGRLLERASELIEFAVRPSESAVADTEVAAVLSKAACAQVEFWIVTDESHAILAPQAGYSVGSLSTHEAPAQLAPRARMLLATAGLMRRRVRRAGGSWSQTADSFFDPQLNPRRRY